MATEGQSSVALWGDEHQQLGEVVTEELGDDCAIALSRGRYPKGYPHLDPNEDAAGAISDGVNRLLAVVDGHSGFDAARAALSAVLGEGDSLQTSDHPSALVRSLFDIAQRAVSSTLSGVRGPRGRSQTTLALVLISNRRSAVIGSLGDSETLLVRNGEPIRLSTASDFLGPDTDLEEVVIAEADMSPEDTLILATDGLTDFLGRDWQQRLAALAHQHQRPTGLAEAAVREAFAGGAGDNIAMAVFKVPGQRPGSEG